MKTREVRIPVYDKDITGDAKINVSIQCLACKHLNDNIISCKAFKNGIPVKILNGGFDHKESYPGDNGIQFEPLE